MYQIGIRALNPMLELCFRIGSKRHGGKSFRKKSSNRSTFAVGRDVHGRIQTAT